MPIRKEEEVIKKKEVALVGEKRLSQISADYNFCFIGLKSREHLPLAARKAVNRTFEGFLIMDMLLLEKSNSISIGKKGERWRFTARGKRLVWGLRGKQQRD